jgi:inward rectifier potassium channel
MKRSGHALSYSFQMMGTKSISVQDAYHWFLRAKWHQVLLAIGGGYVLVNALFACIYSIIGGVAHDGGSAESAREGTTWLGGFFFSVQTFGTIGYGHSYPATKLASTVVTLESFASILFMALVTGLVFAKFSRPTARIAFADKAVIYPFDGVPTLALRLGNERGNRVVEAAVHVDFSRKIVNAEGVEFYRMADLKLVRNRIPALARSFNVLHVIDASSPLFGQTPASLEAIEGEIFVSVTGLDDTSGHTMYGQGVYESHELVFGARHADLLSSAPNGDLLVDASKFDDVVTTAPTADFPYPHLPS